MKKKWIITIIGVLVIPTLVLLFGQGMLNKPKIIIQSGSVNLKIPEKIQANYFLFKMVFMAQDMVNGIFDNLDKNLRELGFPENKLLLIKQSINANLKNKVIVAPIKVENLTKNIDLKPNEERMLLAAIMNMQTMGQAFNQSFLPSRILIFRVTNKGRRDAEDVYIKINMNGGYIDSEIKSEDNVKSKKSIDNNNYEIILDKLSPAGSVSGYIWYDASFSNDIDNNKIVVIYKNGKKEVEFGEGELETIIPK